MLRAYQIEAVKWMIGKETSDNNNEIDPHPFYVRAVSPNGRIVFIHKYLGIYSNQQPTKIRSIPGGILADEMGLGICKRTSNFTLYFPNSLNSYRFFTKSFFPKCYQRK